MKIFCLLLLEITKYHGLKMMVQPTLVLHFIPYLQLQRKQWMYLLSIWIEMVILMSFQLLKGAMLA